MLYVLAETISCRRARSSDTAENVKVLLGSQGIEIKPEWKSD